jgi:hypothetical protein
MRIFSAISGSASDIKMTLASSPILPQQPFLCRGKQSVERIGLLLSTGTTQRQNVRVQTDIRNSCFVLQPGFNDFNIS